MMIPIERHLLPPSGASDPKPCTSCKIPSIRSPISLSLPHTCKDRNPDGSDPPCSSGCFSTYRQN